MIVLSTSALSLRFGTDTVLENVSFSVNEGDRLGIIGVNGAGKTSLFRLITGDYEPTSGSVFLAKDRSVGILRQDEAVTAGEGETVFDFMLAAFGHLTALEEEIARTENALAEACDAEIERLASHLSLLHTRFHNEGGGEFRARCRSMCLRLGFSEAEMDAPIRSLSGGQHTRLALSRLLCREPDILMLDEPTNHLDIDALTWLEDFLKNYRKTVLVISHDRYFLDKVTGKTLQIERTRAKLYNGNYSTAKLQMAMERASQEKAYKEQQKEIAKIEANIEFQRRCGQEHNFVTIRAKEKQLGRMEKVDKVEGPLKEIRFQFQSEASVSRDVLKAKDLSYSYGKEALFEHLSFLIRKDERVLFLGPNGCGKSTLMKLLSGKLALQGGKFDLGYQAKIGYYDQATASFNESGTVFSELHDTYPQKTVGEIRSALALFLFTQDDVEKPISALSGGERARLTLCKLMLMPANLLILDEPTNHLDIGSREALEAAILGFDGTVIAVSHDRYFIDRIATRIMELRRDREDGNISYSPMEGEGAYEAYLRHRATAVEQETPQEKKSLDGREAYEEKKRKEAEARQEAAKQKKAQKRAEELEEQIALWKEELFGDAAADYVRAALLQKQLDEAEEELLSLYEILL